MLPPIDDAVLQSNPEFATLYNTLTTAVLNDDGSTINDPSSKERDAIREKLKKHRLKAAKHHLLLDALSTVSPPPPAEPKPQLQQPKRTATSTASALPSSNQSTTSTDQLPQPLIDLLLLLPPLLSASATDPDRQPPLDPATLDLLLTSPPLSDLPALLPRLWPLLSAFLQTSALSLARHAHPSTNPSYLHRHLPTLGPSIASSTAALSASGRDLTRARLDAAAAVADLQARRAEALGALARALEARHGAPARSVELRAAEVALRARHDEAAAEAALWAARADVYAPDASAALAAYAAHLRDSRVRLAEGCRSRLAELAEYGVVVPEEGDEGGGGGGGGGGDEQNVSAKERTMREMARVFGEMERETEDIQRDLDRLGRA
ncbi:hypothetical protein RB595_005215 [Gaeumannomyces hyphopodioides]